MHPTRRAVIDVGTNSVKLLVADLHPDAVEPRFESSVQTRLGRGLYRSRHLHPDAIAHTSSVIRLFVDTARDHGAVHIRIVATSAAREADNARDLHDSVIRSAGLPMEVIGGDTEARLVYAGVASQVAQDRPDVLLLDVGGGSTELIVGIAGRLQFHESFPLGTVRLLEALSHSDPPTAAELAAARADVHRTVSRVIHPRMATLLSDRPGDGFQLIATGGTATLLARMAAGLPTYDRQAIESVVLHRADITAWVERLWSLSLAGRQAIIGLPPEKADVILTGAAIYESIMTVFQMEPLRVSMRGLRFGALLDPLANWAPLPAAH